METQSAFRRREMTTDDAKNVLAQLAQLGCKRVTISGGEPSLHRGLEEIVRFAAMECHMWVAMNTNASLLKDARLEAILAAGVGQITFSLDSPIAEVHDRVRKLPGNHARIKSRIQRVREITRASGQRVQICINSVLMKDTILTMGAFAEFYAEAPFDYLTLTPASIGTAWDEWTARDETLRPSVADVLQFKATILPGLRRELPALHIDDPFGDSIDEIRENLHVRYNHGLKRCHVGMFHTVVHSNGNVIPCCYAPDDFVMGNAFTSSLEAAWNGEAYASFRGKCGAGQLFPMCKSCRQYVTLNQAVERLVTVETV